MSRGKESAQLPIAYLLSRLFLTTYKLAIFKNYEYLMLHYFVFFDSVQFLKYASI